MNLTYRFPERREAAPDLPGFTPFTEVVPEETIGTIQGITPDSKEEWYTAQGLWRLRHSFIYQYQVGLRGLRGSQRIDFFVTSTVPNPTILQVFGKYWHSGELGSEDAFKLAQLSQEFGNQANIVVLWAGSLSTTEMAYRALLRELGPG